VVDVESSVPEEFVLLRACLASVHDFRKARGKVHPLVGVLCLTVLALMGGARSLSDISRWGKLHSEILGPLKLRRSPSVPTLGRVLRGLSVMEVRDALAGFARQLNGKRGEKDGLRVAAADGKTLKGVWENGKQLHVLHLFAHKSVLALDQVVVGHTAGEIQGLKDWIEQVAKQFPGLQILTADARLADRDLCQAIIDGYKDYVIRLKKTNQACMPMS
jgi:DDE_Tnp_1-associated